MSKLRIAVEIELELKCVVEEQSDFNYRALGLPEQGTKPPFLSYGASKEDALEHLLGGIANRLGVPRGSLRVCEEA